jgi:hypothetical protein
MRRHVIEVLYRVQCPFVTLAIERVRAVVARLSLDLDFEIRLVRIDTMADAVSRRFRGSPSVRVDGVDVDPRASSRPLGTHARRYVEAGAVDRAPPESWIGEALARAAPPPDKGNRAAAVVPKTRTRRPSRERTVS